jgi:hypothetical protein
MLSSALPLFGVGTGVSLDRCGDLCCHCSVSVLGFSDVKSSILLN